MDDMSTAGCHAAGRVGLQEQVQFLLEMLMEKNRASPPACTTADAHDIVTASGVRPPRLRPLAWAMLLAWAVGVGAATAQESAVEFWPEIDVWMRLSPAWRTSLFVPISKNIETNYREGNIVAQADYAWGKTRYDRRLLEESRAQKMNAFLLRGGYLAGKSLGDDGQAYQEHTAFAEFHVRVPLKGNFLFSQRLRTDLRWLGDDAEYSQRWRYRLMIEREYSEGRTSIVPYVNAEPYFDSRYDTVNRIRLIGGATVSWTPRVAIEGNWTYQYDSRSSVTYTDAFNLILHVFFETRASRQNVLTRNQGLRR